MTIGRVHSERGESISLREDLGLVSFKRKKNGDVTFWVQYPNSFMQLVNAALERGISVDLMPKGEDDLHRVGNWRGKLSEFVHAPHLEPYYPRAGNRLTVYSGVRETGRRAYKPPLFFSDVLPSKRA